MAIVLKPAKRLAKNLTEMTAETMNEDQISTFVSKVEKLNSRMEIDNIIKRIHRERSCAILLVEQNLQFVRDMTQRFAILETGRIAVLGEIEALTEDVVRKHLSV